MITTNRNSPAAGSIRVVAWANDGRKLSRDLMPGEILVIGTDPNCGMTLQGERISPLHCMIKYIDGEIRIRDWDTDGGTYVDGERVCEETVVPLGAEICIGEFHIRAEGPTRSEEASGSRKLASTCAPSAGTEHAEAPSAADAHTRCSADTQSGGTQAPAQGEDAKQQPAVAETSGGLEFSSHTSSASSVSGSADRSVGNSPARSRADESEEWLLADPFQQETIELLRAEVEQLQQELAERDERLNELSMQAEQAVSMAAPAEDVLGETESLLERLDQLLDELEKADERVAALEDMLYAADEANRAEQQEREQLEAWVGDIEQRIGEREGEWSAERELLQQRLEQAIAERDRAEQAVDRVRSSRDQSAADERLVESLRSQITELQQRLSAVEQERDELNKQLQANDPSRLEEQINEALREERAELARERAELARRRAELARLEQTLQKMQQADPQVQDSIDSRIRVFREHLREIHEREQQERKQRSLASRVARLWKRLE